MVRTVRLYGDLGKEFGRVHRLAVKTPAEAIRALRANFKTFEKRLIDAEALGIGFVVKNGKEELERAEQARDPASGDISIIPKVIGSSAGARVIIGAALIAVSFIFPAAAPYTLGLGASLVLGGVVEMLSKPPKANEPPEAPENTPSYVFNGPVNTTAQGQPVPIGYGRLIIGGAVISAGITLEQLKSGFKRVKVERIREVTIIRARREVVGPNKIPANFFKRVYLRSEIVPFDQLADVYNYYYYEWILVDYDS